LKISTKFIALFIVTVTTAIAATTIFGFIQFNDEALRQARSEQENRIKTFSELLHQKGRDFEVAEGRLRAGSYILNGNNDLPLKMKELFGAGAGIFLGETRVSTSEVSGSAEPGPKLPAAAYQALFRQGRPFRGEESGYLTAYDPIRDRQGKVIGALCVAAKKGGFLCDDQGNRLKVVGLALFLMAGFSALAVYLIRGALQPLAHLTTASRRIADGSLEEIVGVAGSDEIGTLAEAFNNMTTVIVKNLRGEIDKGNRLFSSIREATGQLSGTTRHVSVISTEQSKCASQQASAVQEVSTASAEMAATAEEITRNAKSVETLAAETATLCAAGSGAVNNATAGMVRLREQVQGISLSMVTLGERSQKIGGIVEIIDEISDRTNLLSLNAALEAAGAGAAGSRFGIVAREVRRLAEQTDEATRRIKGLVEEIQSSANATIRITEDGAKQMDAAVGLVDGVRQSFSGIIGKVEETACSAREIALSTQQQTSACQQMAATMNELRDVAQQVADGTRECDLAMAEVMELTVRLTELIETELESKGKQEARNGARLLENALAELLANQRLQVEGLFDEKYQPIPGTRPQKYHTCYDAVLDVEIQALLDDFLARDAKVIYAILVDRNGYVPTHNTRYSQALTGDPEQDKVWSRSKRIFNDPVGLAAARCHEDVLVQMYFRDTGDKIWDISAPVYVMGRHWGAFRISYTLEP
jgi:methyl-accepting chemotaxis protein